MSAPHRDIGGAVDALTKTFAASENSADMAKMDAGNQSFEFPFFDNQNDSLNLSSRSFTLDGTTTTTTRGEKGQSRHGGELFTPPPVEKKGLLQHHEEYDDMEGGDAAASWLASSPGVAGFGDDENTMRMPVLSPIAKDRDSGGHDLDVKGFVDPTYKDGDSASTRDSITIMSPQPSQQQQEQQREQQPTTDDDPSPVSTTATQQDDLQSAKKQVGEHSSKFINEVTSAAHRRKVAMTRSRDSLVAKEKEQLRSIAESKARLEASALASARSVEAAAEAAVMKRRHRGGGGGGPRVSGLGFAGFGVPKVKKRPMTTPFSPLLGSRRKEKSKVKSLQEPRKSLVLQSRDGGGSTSSRRRSDIRSFPSTASTAASIFNHVSNSTTGCTFKARPAPFSTGREGQAGQAGIPKVPKRPVTIPVSPCLGPKRQPKPGHLTPTNVQRQLHPTMPNKRQPSIGSVKSLTPLSRSLSSAESSVLLGVAFLNSSSSDDRGVASYSNTVPDAAFEQNDENRTPTNQNLRVPSDSATKPYEPLSTCRANKRAEYDARRDKILQERLQDERVQLQNQIKLIHRELAVLRRDI